MAIFRAHEVRQFSDIELLEQEQKLSLELIQERGRSAQAEHRGSRRIREIR